MPHLPLMRWNYLDQLEAAAQQVVNSGSPITTCFVYDAAGQRMRKVTERSAGPGAASTRLNERTYLGVCELYREYGVDGTTVGLARETLHLMDGQQRMALVETRTSGEDGTPEQVVRYQLANHLGSASVEVDGAGEVISYEEYFPYGSTSYQATDSAIRAAVKRYRYTGKERDDETGMAYHGARYYLPWLGRWSACDPIGIRGGVCLYAYVRNSPPNRTDSDGRQDSAMEMAAQAYYGRLEQEVEGYMTGLFGGHADVNTSQNKVEYEHPQGGVGGVVGGLVRVPSLRTIPVESDPTGPSLMGLEFGAAMWPILDPSQRLALGTTVTGQPTSRLAAAGQLALDVVSLGSEAFLASTEARTASIASRAATIERVTTPLSPLSRALPATFVEDVAVKPETIVRAYQQEVVVALSRPGMGIEDKVARGAVRVADRRGVPALLVQELGGYPEVEKVTFVGHANPAVLGGRTGAELHSILVDAGVSPSVVELAGCRTAAGNAPMATDLAYHLGGDVIGYEREIHLASGVPSDAIVVSSKGYLLPFVPAPARPITVSAPLKVR
jgi:RHS repeat-associated protein